MQYQENISVGVRMFKKLLNNQPSYTMPQFQVYTFIFYKYEGNIFIVYPRVIIEKVKASEKFHKQWKIVLQCLVFFCQ